MKKTDSEFGKDSQNLKKYEAEVEKITKELQNMKYQEGAYETTEENVRNLKYEVNATKNQVFFMSNVFWLKDVMFLRNFFITY